MKPGMYLVILFVLFSLKVFAGPAIPTPVTVVQPDGAEIEVLIRGDEFQGWNTTADGYTIVQDEDTGYWEYAVQDNQGNLEPSGSVVNPEEAPPSDIPQDIRPPMDERRAREFNDRLSVLYQKRAVGKIAGTWNPVPITGNQNLLVVRVNFADRALNGGITKANINSIVFDPAQKSVKRFYAENSFGDLSINPVPHTQDAVAGIIDVTLAMNHPDNILPPTPSIAQEHAVEIAWIQAAIDQIESNGWLDLDPYDTNLDNQITPDELSIYFIVAGYEESGSAKTPSVWAHAWFMWASGDVTTNAGKDITDWAMNGEMNDSNLMHPMGVIVHELGHQLCGLPDLYDITYTNSGLGLFSTMAAGSWGGAWGEPSGTTPISLDAWSRQYLGWSTPQTPSANGALITFPTALSGAAAPLKLVNSLVTGTEFFLAENRYPEKWDLGFQLYFGPGWTGGLLIMHCDITVGSGVLSAGNDINEFHAGTHQGIMAEEATLTNAPSLGGDGHWTTLFYSGNADAFTDATTPGSKYYDGSASNFGLTGISVPGLTMTATASIPAWVTVTSPNGGETWASGDTPNITWTSGGIANVKIEYSDDNGSSWNAIIGSTPAAAGSHPWNIPNIDSAACLIRISDAATPALADRSNAVFTITGTPEITVTAPNGGETWAVGFPEDITWSSVSVDDVKIEYSTNGGGGWTVITASTPAAAGSYAWTVPNDASANCLIRISKATDAGLNDVSDAAFTITDTAALTLTAPDGGENWPVASVKQITWTSTNVYTVRIEYSSNNGSSWNLVIASTPASANSYNWTVPNDVSAACLVRISKAADLTVTDQSAATFTISAPPTVTVTSPDGGERWFQGESRSLTWTSTNCDNVDIAYSINSGSTWNNIALGQAAAGGTYAWIVPAINSSSCLIRVANSDYPDVKDQSDAVFTIMEVIDTVEARSMNAINSYVYKWNGAQYVPVSIDESQTLQPWEAVWVVVSNDFDLLIPGDPAHHGVGFDAPAAMNIDLNPNVWYSFSPPLDPGAGARTVSNTFNAMLGVPETDYRISKWNYLSRSYDHYTNGNDIVGDGGDVLPGRGLWVYHTSGALRTVTLTGSGVDPLPVETYYKLKLPANGAFTTHLVGNPFWYAVDWSDIKFSSPMTGALPLGKPAASSEPAVIDWEIELGLRTGDNMILDTYNRAGILTNPDADPSLLWALDFVPMGDHVRLHITDPDDADRIALAYDYRAANRPEYRWRLNLNTSFDNIAAVLSLDGLDAIPAAYDVFLTDEQAGTTWAVVQDFETEVELASDTERTFLLSAVARAIDSPPENQAELALHSFMIESIAPNPFNPATSITYSIEHPGMVNLSVYNLSGQRVAELVDETQAMGTYTIDWNATGYSSGMYLVILRQHGLVTSSKITLIK